MHIFINQSFVVLCMYMFVLQVRTCICMKQQVLRETALVEAFNLKAAIEYQLKNCMTPL